MTSLEYWRHVANAAAERGQGDDIRDIAATLAACQMVDALEHNRPVPKPTPEYMAKLTRAEVLAHQK